MQLQGFQFPALEPCSVLVRMATFALEVIGPTKRNTENVSPRKLIFIGRARSNSLVGRWFCKIGIQNLLGSNFALQQRMQCFAILKHSPHYQNS